MTKEGEDLIDRLEQLEKRVGVNERRIGVLKRVTDAHREALQHLFKFWEETNDHLLKLYKMLHTLL